MQRVTGIEPALSSGELLAFGLARYVSSEEEITLAVKGHLAYARWLDYPDPGRRLCQWCARRPLFTICYAIVFWSEMANRWIDVSCDRRSAATKGWIYSNDAARARYLGLRFGAECGRA